MGKLSSRLFPEPITHRVFRGEKFEAKLAGIRRSGPTIRRREATRMRPDAKRGQGGSCRAHAQPIELHRVPGDRGLALTARGPMVAEVRGSPVRGLRASAEN